MNTEHTKYIIIVLAVLLVITGIVMYTKREYFTEVKAWKPTDQPWNNYYDNYSKNLDFNKFRIIPKNIVYSADGFNPAPINK